MSLLRRLIESAGEEGGEEWVRRCLDLRLSTCQKALVGAATATAPLVEAAVEDVRPKEEASVWNGTSPLPDLAEEDRMEEEVCRSGVRISSGPEGGTTKRRRTPRQRYFPSASRLVPGGITGQSSPQQQRPTKKRSSSIG